MPKAPSLEGSFIRSKSENLRHRAATLALVATVGLTLSKLLVGFVSQSVGVLSEGVHSFLDLVSAAVAFFAIRVAGKPADQDHPYGHGKIETLSSLLESLLLLLAAAWMIWEGFHHLRSPQPLQHQGWALFVITASIFVSYGMYRHNLHAAGATESSAIHVNALHFLADTITSIGVLIGLLVIRFTGWFWIDSLIAFGIAIYIVSISWVQIRQALQDLTDTHLPASELKDLQSLLQGSSAPILEAHDLRTRKGGATRHIDFHLVVCGKMTVSRSHEVCDELEEKILARFPQSSVTIHVEPCEHHQSKCHVECHLIKTEGAS